MGVYRDWIVERLGGSSSADKFHAALADMARTGRPVVLLGRPMSGKTTVLSVLRSCGSGILLVDEADPGSVVPGVPAVYTIPLGNRLLAPLFRIAEVFELEPIRTAMDPSLPRRILQDPDISVVREAFSAYTA